MLIVAFMLTFCYILFLYALLSNYNYSYRSIYKTILTILYTFHMGKCASARNLH